MVVWCTEDNNSILWRGFPRFIFDRKTIIILVYIVRTKLSEDTTGKVINMSHHASSYYHSVQTRPLDWVLQGRLFRHSARFPQWDASYVSCPSRWQSEILSHTEYLPTQPPDKSQLAITRWDWALQQNPFLWVIGWRYFCNISTYGNYNIQ